MIIGITGEVNNDSFEKLVKAYNELKEKEDLEIYLNSEGGYTDYAEAIIDIINTHREVTSMVGYGELLSAGFDIFFRSLCEKSLLRGTLGMAHLSRVETSITIKSGKTQDEHEAGYKKWSKKDKIERLLFYEKLGMTQSELLKIKSGKEVYFDFDRLAELLKHTHGEPL